MKTLNNYIAEKLIINKDFKNAFYDDCYKELPVEEAIKYIKSLNNKDIVCNDKNTYYEIVYHKFKFCVTFGGLDSKNKSHNVICFGYKMIGPKKFIHNEELKNNNDKILFFPARGSYREAWLLCKYIINELIQACIDEG